MGGLAKDTKPKKRFPLFFGRFSGPKNLDANHGQNVGADGKASTMILKLKTPGAAGGKAEESSGQLLSDILTNEPLFDMLYGKSLVLHAEMTVEKHRDDGTPKTMIISGLVPVTLSKGERNGRPTRELRVRGHLRRKRSRQTRLPYDDLALTHSGFGSGGRRREMPSGRRPKPPEESKLLQRNSKVLERYRTLSTVSVKSKRGSVWPQTDADVDTGDEDLESSRIENWSPLFDFSSPMSGPTGRDRARAMSDWTTPTPRFDLNLLKDDGEERSKEDVPGVGKEKKPRCNQQSQKPKDDFKVVDRTLVIGRTDSSDQDENDKCSAKPCCKDKRNETRDTGSQTYNGFKGKDATRVHSSTQTDAYRELNPSELPRTQKRMNLLSTEEIQQKLAKGFNESKQMLSSVHEKAANKFAEVHGKIQDAIHKRGGEMYAEYQDTNRPNHSDGYHPMYEQADLSHNDGQNYETGNSNDRGASYPRGRNQTYGQGHPIHKMEQSHSEKHGDSPPKTRSNISQSSRDKFCPGETIKDFARDTILVSSPSRDQVRGQSKNTGRRVKTPDGHVHEKPRDLQSLRYDTQRGYYYEPPEDYHRGKDMNTNILQDNSGSVRTRLNMSKEGGEERPSPGTSPSKNDKKPKSRTPTPNGSKKSQERIGGKISDTHGKPETKQHMNPISTITVSRSHTRFYNYSDGYTYTEKAGRQMVVIEAPKGMYFAS